MDGGQQQQQHSWGRDSLTPLASWLYNVHQRWGEFKLEVILLRDSIITQTPTQSPHLTWLAGWVELMLCDVMWWDDRQTTCIHNWITQRRCRWGLGARKYLFSTTVTCVWLSGLSSIHFLTLPELLFLLLSCRCCCCCLNAAVLTMNLRLPHHYHATTYVLYTYPTR